MAFIQVTARELRNKAEVLKGLNGQFRTKTSELNGQESALCSMWEGQARDLFHQAYLRDEQQMQVFTGLIDRYIEALLEIAAIYEQAEAKNSEIASARTY